MLAQPSAVLALAGGPTLTAVSSVSTVAVNDTFIVTVQMDTKTYQVTAAEIHLSYPTDKLQALTVAAGSFLPAELEHYISPTGASVTVGSGVSSKQGTGPVAIFTFRAVTAGTVQIGFTTGTQVAASGVSSNAVDTMTPVTVTVTGAGNATTTPTPTLTPTPTAYYTYTPVPYSTPTPTGIAGVSQVQTGPGETTILGLILASIITLLYVGYTGSDAFRRNEAKSYSEEARKSPPNFKK